jgi:uncharacterized cofD-like protein
MGAKMIVTGPGDLYTGLPPNHLVGGEGGSLRRSPAPKIFVCNAATQPGETSDYSIHDHFETLERYEGPGLFDYVVANSNHSISLSPAAQEAGIQVSGDSGKAQAQLNSGCS